MGNDDKFFPDDEIGDDTVTRKIRMLEERGVLDKPGDDPDAFDGTTTITTYPFAKTKKSSHIGQLFEWFKKN